MCYCRIHRSAWHAHQHHCSIILEISVLLAVMADATAYIVGIGVTPWGWPRDLILPLKTQNAAIQLSMSAGIKALLDAGITYESVDHAFMCDCMGDDTSVPYKFGRTGIPIQRTGAESGLFAASRLIKTGSADCVLLLSVDKVSRVRYTRQSCSLLTHGSMQQLVLSWAPRLSFGVTHT